MTAARRRWWVVLGALWRIGQIGMLFCGAAIVIGQGRTGFGLGFAIGVLWAVLLWDATMISRWLDGKVHGE